MDKFSLNEVAVVIRGQGETDPWMEKYIGEEVEVISGLELSERTIDNCYYKVKASDGLVFGATPSSLRKKKPKEEPATWQEIQRLTNWNPTKEVVL